MNRLTRLANKYKTDKGTKTDFRHGFTEYYEPYLLKYENPKILELGTGTGASAKMFSAFYDGECEIISVDINDLSAALKDVPNCKTVQLDLGDENKVNEFIESLGDKKFDIIIDDASHLTTHQYISLIKFCDLVNDGGIFIMEDLHCSYSDENFEETLFAFLTNFKFNSYFLNQAEYDIFMSKIKNIITFNLKNYTKYSDEFKNRSVTSIITFE